MLRPSYLRPPEADLELQSLRRARDSGEWQPHNPPLHLRDRRDRSDILLERHRRANLGGPAGWLPSILDCTVDVTDREPQTTTAAERGGVVRCQSDRFSEVFDSAFLVTLPLPDISPVF